MRRVHSAADKKYTFLWF